VCTFVIYKRSKDSTISTCFTFLISRILIFKLSFFASLSTRHIHIYLASFHIAMGNFTCTLPYLLILLMTGRHTASIWTKIFSFFLHLIKKHVLIPIVVFFINITELIGFLIHHDHQAADCVVVCFMKINSIWIW